MRAGERKGFDVPMSSCFLRACGGSDEYVVVVVVVLAKLDGSRTVRRHAKSPTGQLAGWLCRRQ